MSCSDLLSRRVQLTCHLHSQSPDILEILWASVNLPVAIPPWQEGRDFELPTVFPSGDLNADMPTLCHLLTLSIEQGAKA